MINVLRRLIPHRSPIRLGWHYTKACLAALYYLFPARNLIIIGVTGTDGKTTTVGMTAHILHHAGYTVGALSTAFFRRQDHIQWNATQKTSPSPFTIQKFLKTCVRSGCTHVVLEYSSHGLVQGRTLFTWPLVAAITNISEEHLDYHGSLEQYKKDKEKIFAMLRRNGARISTFDIRHSTFDIRLKIPGKFNVENAKIALACAEAIGVSRDVAIEALKSFTGIPGRLERIDEGQAFSVFVDFTVTPRAYTNTLTALREMLQPGKRLLVLTGSCGDRMKEKRPQIGRICSELADVVVVSNEDPYTEDPQRIIDDVWNGIDQTQTYAQRIPDRRAAIEYLFSAAHPRDIVLLAGKGSDTTMWVKEGQIPWNERQIARELLTLLSHSCPPTQQQQSSLV
jgi:UDP-N-acetylmuramoyl-L-alanyl-D-glutamate--2,6-diaminopimelate ligase